MLRNLALVVMIATGLVVSIPCAQAKKKAPQPVMVEPIPPGYRPAPGSDEAELWYILDKVELDAKQSPYRIRDEGLNRYVREVTCKVTGPYCNDLRIYVMDIPRFNASMSPNGMMMIWSGALLRMRNEAELALVIGHEFGHYKHRHTLSQWRKSKRTSAWLTAFGLAAGGTGYDTAAYLFAVMNMAKFSRDMEREADRIGFGTIVAQDYDPHVGAQLWERMLREEKATDHDRPLPVFASHPQSRERRDDLLAAAQAVAQPGKQLGLEAYRAVTNSYLVRWLDAEVARRRFNGSLVALNDVEQGGAPEHRGLFTFYRGEVLRRRNREGDKAEAAKAYAQAVSTPGAPASAWREHGLMLKSAGDKSEATKALRRYLELTPKAEDRAFIERYLRELGATP